MGIFHFPALAGHRKKDVEKKRPAPQRRGGLRMALGAGTVLILSFLLSMHLLPNKVSLQVGDISDQTIRAHRTVRYVDSVETQRLRMEAASRVEKQYRDERNAAFEQAEAISNIFDILHRARIDNRYPTLTSKVHFVSHSLGVVLTNDSLQALLTCDPRTFNRIESYSDQLIREIMSKEIRDDNHDVERARAEFRRRVNNYLGNAPYTQAAAQIGDRCIKPNRIFDAGLTEKTRRSRADHVSPQFRPVFLGETIIQKGERVTPEHIDKFTALGLRNPSVDYVSVMCIALLVMLVVLFTIAYLARYHTRTFASTKLMVLLSLIVIFCVLGLKLGSTMLGITLNGVQFGYFTISWIVTAGMLATILLSPQIAILVVALLSTTSGLAMNHELRWALAPLLSSLVAIYAVSDIRHRSDLFLRAAAAVCTANLVVVWLTGRLGGDEWADLLVGSVWAVAGGAGSIMLFALVAAALEKPFGITTHNRLVELSDTNNPMLKRLLMEAPGTYSHSIYVGNIASVAADVIGADAFLVRVASYYHDIGKIKRPHFFVENQYVENVHDRLNPSLSALVIRSHIKDGLDLAREYRLPPLICELMGQHHGTSLVRYFYSQAAENIGNNSTALEQQFRYDGDKPRSKEAALLMLADSVEAASRALSKPTPGQIENMVDGIVGERLSDGQLDESELTFKDISRIRDSFVRTLTSMMHARIEYPELPTTEGKKTGGNGSAGKEPLSGTGGSESSDRSGQEIAAG